MTNQHRHQRWASVCRFWSKWTDGRMFLGHPHVTVCLLGRLSLCTRRAILPFLWFYFHTPFHSDWCLSTSHSRFFFFPFASSTVSFQTEANSILLVIKLIHASIIEFSISIPCNSSLKVAFCLFFQRLLYSVIWAGILQVFRAFNVLFLFFFLLKSMWQVHCISGKAPWKIKLGRRNSRAILAFRGVHQQTGILKMPFLLQQVDLSSQARVCKAIVGKELILSFRGVRWETDAY